MSSSNAHLKIAIIGAGLAGLALSRTLRQNGIPCTVYELDAARDSRPQGGTLDLHVESGQLAMRTNGLWDQVQSHIRYEGQDLRILDKMGKIWLDKLTRPDEVGRPEVDRGILREIYLDSLEEGTVQWGVRVKDIVPVNFQKDTDNTKLQTRYTLVFCNGKEETFDLVVGADGAWSRTRLFISDAKPIYSGVSFVECRFPNVDDNWPEVSKFVGLGSMYALSDNKALAAQRNGDGSIRLYVTIRIAEKDLSEKEFLDESSTKKHILNMFNDWSEDFKDLIRKSQGAIVRPIHALPVQHHWVSRPGVTIIGDAAHLMSPFAGEGANLAMIDGVDLGLAIAKVVKHGEDLPTVQEQFERSMIARSQVAAQLSATSLDLFINPDAPRITMPMIEQLVNKTRDFQQIGDSIAAKELEQLQHQLENFKSNLEEFAWKHRKDIRKNPTFRAHFQRMCANIGVDPLASNKGFWADLLGVGDFYYELGIQIIDGCMATRSRDGGLTDLGDLRKRLEVMRSKKGIQQQEITEDDMIRAIRTLKPLSGGYEVLTIGDRKMVRSVPKELDKDQSALLVLAQKTGYVDAIMAQQEWGWNRARIDKTLQLLLQDGLAWIDSQGDVETYWIPSYFKLDEDQV
ncbi:hypothetical protein EC973_005058 [Apophysomyces ossiformis]|uniref:FAD-binding domain-containing protein n=1 Tax=Apophysomyces ossiformis TaxID=679940 RepID=A0A8H7BWN0_9FUNG|nr:hypothetical protein EC973_005058 [Apophysomyces ossiformis]